MKVWRAASKDWHVVGEGVRRKVLGTSKDCMVVLYEIKAGASVPMHSHPEEQLGIIIDGKGVFTTERGEIEVVGGDSYVIESNERHAFTAKQDCLVVDVFVPPRKDFADEVSQADEEG